MALFSRKKEETGDESAAVAKKTPANTASVIDRNISAVIKKPRITEKAVGKTDSRVYTFEVSKDATKYDVRDAVKELFSVTPMKVNIVNKAPRKRMSRSRGRVVREKGLKKAYVYLRPGETINFI